LITSGSDPRANGPCHPPNRLIQPNLTRRDTLQYAVHAFDGVRVPASVDQVLVFGVELKVLVKLFWCGIRVVLAVVFAF
jgi:hypothetical protein